MKLSFVIGIFLMSASLGCALAMSQESQKPSPVRTHVAADRDDSPVPLDWTPPALAELGSQATTKSSFSLDRSMLGLAASMVPDSDAPTREAINKIDGVSVHLLRFGPAGIADEGQVDAIRSAYHLRGWKHLVTTSNTGGPLHNGTTDVWFVLDGTNVKGAVVLAETPKSLTLVTVAGNLSPMDLMHLRGHFGIPNLNSGDFKDAPGK
jgi:hypothetical protein